MRRISLLNVFPVAPSRLRCGRSVGWMPPGLALRLASCLSLIIFAQFACTNVAQGIEVVVMSGVDTTLPSGTGLNGSDAPHGTDTEWEWDGSDGGGENQGLIWFDIPSDVFIEDATVNSATLKLSITNEGSNGSGHRITSDWLSGLDGGDNITYNLMPDGPGIVPGDNAVVGSSFMTGDLSAGTIFETDVTADVQAWFDGEANYGWGILPAGGTNGVGIAAFEHASTPVPMLTIDYTPPARLPDLDGDGDVDRDDFDILNGNMFAHLDGASVVFEDGDINFDSAIDLLDFRRFKDEFPGIVNAALGIPEPGTLSLATAALIGIFVFGRRLRSSGNRFDG